MKAHPSMNLPCVGQFYNRNGGDDALFLIGHFLLSAWFVSEEARTRDCDDSREGPSALFLIGNWIVAEVDAFQDAKRINAGLPPESIEANLDLGLGFSIAPDITPRHLNTPFGNRVALDAQVAR